MTMNEQKLKLKILSVKKV